MDNDDDFVNEDVNEDEYLSEDPDDDEEFDINAGNLPAFANAENRALSKALEEKEARRKGGRGRMNGSGSYVAEATNQKGKICRLK